LHPFIHTLERLQGDPVASNLVTIHVFVKLLHTDPFPQSESLSHTLGEGGGVAGGGAGGGGDGGGIGGAS